MVGFLPIHAIGLNDLPSLPEYKQMAKAIDLPIEKRSLAALATVALGFTCFKAYNAMKQGFTIEQYDAEKELITGHEIILASVRQKIIDLLRINPENKSDLAELKAEEQVLLQEIDALKKTDKKWNLIEAIKAKSFKHITKKDILIGTAPLWGTALLSIIGVKAGQLFCRINNNEQDAKDIWKNLYKEQENIYTQLARGAKVLFDVSGLYKKELFDFLSKHQPEHKVGIAWGIAVPTIYMLKEAKEKLEYEKLEKTKRFSYLNDFFGSPLQVIKAIGPSGAASWVLQSYLASQLFSKILDLEAIRYAP